MSLSRPVLTVIALCAIVIVLSLLGLVFDFTTLMEFHADIDGLLMLFVCLMMGGLFSLMLFLIAKDQGWLPRKKQTPVEGK
jgi:hypothetical protein